MMEMYDILMKPIELFFLKNIRAELLLNAKGNVLEVGVGTGINQKYYDFSKVSTLTYLDIEHSPTLACEYPDIKFIAGNIEKMPFEPQTFDCIVSTLVLCSVDIEKSVNEIHRVLKHGGILIFIEHVKPSGAVTSKIAEVLNHTWSKIAKGCNINRQTDLKLKNSRFNKITINQKNIFRYGVAEK